MLSAHPSLAHYLVLVCGILDVPLINIPMTAINTGLNNFLSNVGSSAVLLGLLVGMMAVDMDS